MQTNYFCIMTGFLALLHSCQETAKLTLALGGLSSGYSGHASVRSSAAGRPLWNPYSAIIQGEYQQSINGIVCEEKCKDGLHFPRLT